MSASLKKLYLEAIDALLGEFIKENPTELEDLIQPIRYYLADIERFSSLKLFETKVKNLVKTRDQLLGQGTPVGEAQASPNQEKVNALLSQVLELLERGLTSNETHSLNLAEITEKVRQAKTLTSLQALSDAMLDAGKAFADESRDFRKDMSRLAVEISYNRDKIEQLEKELKEKKSEAERDHLTGLLNRRAFDAEIKLAMGRAQRFRTPLALMLIDIDHFKEINDRYGHQVGDDVLRNFAALLQKGLRDMDQTFRLGGDEFAVVFATTEVERAVGVGQRMCEFVSKKPYSVKNVKFHTTISVGMTEYRLEESEEELFKRADDLLYKAKRGGRNGLCSDISRQAS